MSFYLNKAILIHLGNTRVITQTALQKFQEDMGKVMKDPYQVVMKQTKLPITLLNERAKVGDIAASVYFCCYKILMLISSLIFGVLITIKAAVMSRVLLIFLVRQYHLQPICTYLSDRCLTRLKIDVLALEGLFNAQVMQQYSM